MNNKVIQIGRITKDLELKSVGSDKVVCKFNIAVDRKFKKEGQPTADFFNCEVWGKTAEAMCNYTSKGSMISVGGRLRSGSYEKDGTRIYTTDIVVEDVTFLDSKKAVNEDSEPVVVEEGDDELPF